MAAALILAVSGGLAGCAHQFVAPYDQKLVDDTDGLYKKAAAMVAKGTSVSPRRDAERAAILDPTRHPAHYSAFKPGYDDLLLDTDALILRAMSGSAAVGGRGRNLQEDLGQVIAGIEQSQCPDLQQAFGNASLTAANFVDLKCLFARWSQQHQDHEATRGTAILKKGDREGHKLALFNAVLAIQQAERFKRDTTQ